MCNYQIYSKLKKKGEQYYNYSPKSTLTFNYYSKSSLVISGQTCSTYLNLPLQQ